MFISDAETRLATDIVSTWSSSRSNYIIIAPPMSRPRVVFNQLSNRPFLENILNKAARNISIARLDTLNFKSEETFVDAVMAGWNLDDVTKLKRLNPIEKMEAGICILKDAQKTPILLIQRFHEALQKLGEDIGTCLRNLEHDFGLKTVVELPVSLHVLRERWDLASVKSPFLASDWGQGHGSKLLKGYNRDEVAKIIAEGGNPESDVHLFAYDATCGLPELLQLIVEDCKTLKLGAVKARVRNKSHASCGRILGWLDRPGENTYKNLFTLSLTQQKAESQQSLSSLKDHDWSELFAKTAEVQRPLMLAWASVDALIDQCDTKFESHVKNLFLEKRYEEVFLLAENALPKSDALRRKWKMLGLIAEFGIHSDPFNPNWSELANILDKIEIYLSSNTSDDSNSIAQLLQWRDLVSLMLRFDAVKPENLRRLEEFVCDIKGSEEGMAVFIQLLQLRLSSAMLMPTYLSVKSIIEQPESLIQLHAYAVHKIKFWSFGGDDPELAQRISASIKKPFTLPRRGNRLSFVELIYICYQYSQEKGQSDLLASDLKCVNHLEALYDIRKDVVHSTGFMSSAQAHAYHDWCADWIDKLKNSISIKLPKLIDVQSISKSFF